MLFLKKDVATELIERNDHALEHVGLDGEKRTYLPARSMWLRLEQLHVAQQLAEPLDADKQPTLSTSLHGVAHLDDQELSIIGDAGHAMHTVEVSFAARDVSRADRLGLRELEDDLGISFSDVPLGTARLGVNRADAKTGEPDQWWLACHIPEACIQALSKAISDGQLGAVELGLALRHLYADESAMANPQREPNLFLRPNKSDGTIEWPEIAIGYVTHLRIDFATAQLRAAAASGVRDNELTTNAVADAVNSLALRLTSLMRWIAFFFAVLLFLEVLERL